MTTQTIGSWNNITDPHSLSPHMSVEAVTNGDEAFDTDAIVAAYLETIQDTLPEGVQVLGNGDFIADIDADYDYDEMVEDVRQVELDLIEK